VVQEKCFRGEVLLSKAGPDGLELELALDADEAAALLGEQHLAVREARAFGREARVRELARLEAEVVRLRESRAESDANPPRGISIMGGRQPARASA
jgi:hypothetical protein